jgi:hypothetical protein
VRQIPYVIALLCLPLASTTATAQDRIGILCYGEKPQENCPKNTTIFRGCNTDAKEEGKTFCTMTTKDGSVVVPHFVDFIAQKHGNQCGYNWFKITCKMDK